jgi:uncharacterized protein (TIGR03118 family)
VLAVYLEVPLNRRQSARYTTTDTGVSFVAPGIFLRQGDLNMTRISPAINRTLHGRWTLTAIAAAAALVAACGGGGYGGGGSGSPPPPAITLTIAPSTIVLGQSATLTWSSSAGSTCDASGAWSGTQVASGSAPETPTAAGSATYTLSCTGSGAYGGNVSKSVTLTVNAPTAFTATALVGDTAAAALTTDANLVNPWGIAFSPTSFAWVANNHSETSTLYDGDGVAQPVPTALIVNLPASGAAVSFDPTGIVFNGTATDFVVTAGAVSGSAAFIFAGEGGMIGGWSRTVDPTHVVSTYTDAGGAVYKGLALANNGSGNFLYATDFHNGKIDVFNSSFVKQTPSATSFAFTDPTLPAGYAPFGIVALKNGTGGATQLYVSYAQQLPPDNHDNANGAGLGLVNIFDTNGVLIKHLVATGGSLNAPWGMALAPSDFGTLSGTLLVGNFGDGKINAFDAVSGSPVGTVADSTGTAFAAPGLWGMAFGNDSHNQPHNTLFYTAGLNNEANGVYGRIDVGAAPALNAKPVVTLTAPTTTGLTTGTIAVSATASDVLGVAKVEFFATSSTTNVTTSLGVVTTSPYSVQWNTTAVADDAYQVTATATNADSNAATSTAITVTVQNTPSTLSFLQTKVFTPICSGCHNGSVPTSGALPASQNLTAGNTFANIVGITSHEVPTLMRVKPGDPANSYLVQKVEGAAGISGVRMPAGGTPLDQVTIDQIKSWIAAGALNN